MTPSPSSRIEEAIGYRFKDGRILEEALTHKSLHYESPGVAPLHNERLEFLGDSVLALVVSERLFSMHGRMDESEMSKIKSYVVKRAVLAEAARGLPLGGHLRLGRGEDESGGRKKQSILANALEALIGAVYVDGGIEEARGVVLRLLGGRLSEVARSGQYHDYKTELQEACQLKFGVLPEYRVRAVEGREHEKTFTVEVSVSGRVLGAGEGRNKKEAEAEAAKKALSFVPAGGEGG